MPYHPGDPEGVITIEELGKDCGMCVFLFSSKTVALEEGYESLYVLGEQALKTHLLVFHERDGGELPW